MKSKSVEATPRTTGPAGAFPLAAGSPSEKAVLKFCDEVRNCDDNLGRVSDHEGSEEGPTYAAWRRGPDAFEHHAEAVISWHKHAITVYRRGLKLNARRRRANDRDVPTSGTNGES